MEHQRRRATMGAGAAVVLVLSATAAGLAVVESVRPSARTAAAAGMTTTGGVRPANPVAGRAVPMAWRSGGLVGSDSGGDGAGEGGDSAVTRGGARPAGDVTPATDMPSQVAAYVAGQDRGGRLAPRISKIVESGGFLRLYTTFPEDHANSRSVVALCEWTVEFLRRQPDGRVPIVFVHARRSGNGNVVLAGKQSATDDCRVG